MKRPLQGLVLAAGLALSACAQPVEVTPLASPQPSATLAPTLPPSPTPVPPTATTAPQPTAAEASLFAPVTEADWQIGPAGARVTIVEYGDFQ